MHEDKRYTGGGAGTLSGLTDTTISTPADDQVLTYDSTTGKWINANPSAGGHTMIPVTNDIATVAALTDGTDNYVINAYTAKRYSNAEVTTILTTASQDTDTIGYWTSDDSWKDPGASRSGWLWDAELYGVLSDNSIEISPVFDVSGSEAVGLYSMRIDDDVTNNGVNGGAIALKLTGPIQNALGVKVGINLKRQRTNLKNFTVLS